MGAEQQQEAQHARALYRRAVGHRRQRLRNYAKRIDA